MTPMVTKVSSTPFEVGGLEVLHQHHRERRRDQGAAAEAHDGHARGHAGAIREPLDQRRYRRDVADAEPAAAQHAVAQIEQPQLMQMNAERGDEEAAAEAQGGGEHGFARTDPFHPTAEHGRGRAEEDDGDGEDPAHLLQIPVAGRRMSDADQLGERQIEGREGIGLADRQMHRQGGGGDQEPVESGGATVLSRSRNEDVMGALRYSL